MTPEDLPARTGPAPGGSPGDSPPGSAGAPEREGFELSGLFGYVLARLSASAAALAEAEAQAVAGLTLPEYRLLAMLTARGPMGVVELQHATRIDKAWVSRTLAKLVAKGLVAASAAPHDARRVAYQATPAGQRTGAQLIERAMQRQQGYFEGFSADEVAQLLAFIGRVQANVDRRTPS
jgi:DNA-binding MarR family transcriptional regulator